MANHKNDHSHERTLTVAVREEVDRALSSVPAKQRQEAVQKVGQIIERYSSPYPDPNYLKQIESLCPGATKDIIAASIDDLKHRQRMDEAGINLQRDQLSLIKEISNGEVASTKQGRLIGFAAYIGCLIFSGAMLYLGSETLALAGFGAAALGIIGQLIRGGSHSVVMTTEHIPDEDDNSGKQVTK